MYNVKEEVNTLKQKIIKVANELFMKNGYLATSTRDISNALNITQPALYHHFKNKEEIYVAVLEDFALEIGDSLHQYNQKELPKGEILKEMALYLKESHPVNFAMMMNDIEKEISAASVKNIFNIWYRTYLLPFNIFFESLNSKLKPEFTPEIASRHFLRMFSAYLSESKPYPYADDLNIVEMIRIFLFGITQEKYHIDLFVDQI